MGEKTGHPRPDEKRIVRTDTRPLLSLLSLPFDIRFRRPHNSRARGKRNSKQGEAKVECPTRVAAPTNQMFTFNPPKLVIIFFLWSSPSHVMSVILRPPNTLAATAPPRQPLPPVLDTCPTCHRPIQPQVTPAMHRHLTLYPAHQPILLSTLGIHAHRVPTATATLPCQLR